MTNNEITCEECPYFLEEKEKALNRNNSAYDAVIDMWAFKDECQKAGCKIKRV